MRTDCLVIAIAAAWASALCGAPKAEILWDTYGVPHIYSKSAGGLTYAFGYAQMQSHANLILQLYGQSRGRGAEYWGEKHLELDEWVRMNDVPAIAARWLQEQKPQFREMLEQFAAGMNQYARDHPDQIAAENRVVLPVVATDPLAHTLRVIHLSFVARTGDRGAPVLAANWKPAPATAPAVSSGHDDGDGSLAGSNTWAIAPKRSASGKAMLVCNPHLRWSDFYMFYEAHLNAPGYSMYGTTLVGNPLITIGFNANLGWSHTVNTHDGADLFELTLAEGGYKFDNAVKRFSEREETLKIRQKDGSLSEKTLKVRQSIHGPVIAEKNGRALAFRVVALDQPHMLEQYWRMGGARNLKEFEVASAMLQMPMFTTMYADKDGHILHLFGGRTPVRKTGDWAYWSRVVAGSSAETLWTSTHPYSELPKVVDPPSGWLQNANDPPWTTTFPLALDPAKFPPYMAPRRMEFRPQRSARMIAEDSSITFDELVAYKQSTRLELADRVLDEVVDAAEKQGQRDAAEVLRKWDRSTDASSKGAVLFEVFWTELAKRSGGVNGIFRESWNENEARSTPRGLRDASFVGPAMASAVEQVLKAHGKIDVEWGEVNRLRVADADVPGNGASGDLGAFRVTYFAPDQDGKRRAVAGDAFYAAVEFSQPVRARVLTAYGNSTQPGSAHRTDQIRHYSRKEMREPWLNRTDVEKHLEARKAF